MTVLAMPITVRALRAELTKRFVAAGVESPSAEARDVIAAVVDKPRFWPVDHGGDALGEDVVHAVREAVERRAQGMPFAYAVGKAAFRHLTLAVDRRVLIPRQETELLVDLVLEATGSRGIVADIGTGSGCIAIALATEGRFDRVIATDVSQEQTAIPQMNAAAYCDNRGCCVEVREGDLLRPITPQDRVTAIVSNPPYIAPHEMAELPSSVRDWEPHLALFSANNGLACTFQIIDDAALVLPAGGLLALEVDSRRAQQVAAYIQRNGSYRDIRVHNDFTDRERFVLAHAR